VLKELEEAAPTTGVKLQRVEVRAPADFEGAFKAATRQRAGGLLVPGDPLTANRFKMIADLALTYRLPTTAENKAFVQDGGLLSWGRTSSIRTAGPQRMWTRFSRAQEPLTCRWSSPRSSNWRSI
jgi:ABC-type uncharacterized transport system substrate-binding protein